MQSFLKYLDNMECVAYADEFGVPEDDIWRYIVALVTTKPSTYGADAPFQSPHQWDDMLCAEFDTAFPALH